MLASMLQLILRWLNDSLAAANTTTSAGQVARGPDNAASRPCKLGTNTEWQTRWPGFAKADTPAITAAASAICGTHFGLTKLVTSMWRRPACCSWRTSSILSAVATACASFCKPSRGPTSSKVTWWGSTGQRLGRRRTSPREAAGGVFSTGRKAQPTNTAPLGQRCATPQTTRKRGVPAVRDLSSVALNTWHLKGAAKRAGARR
jgi:hypothetical protein